MITAQNGFNCTQGHSGHSNPCVIRKVGVVKMLSDARTKPKRGEGPFVPLFVNLVVQNREIGDAARLRAGRRDQGLAQGRVHRGPPLRAVGPT